MPKRATKRGAERTPLSGDYDVLICGASFAGLAVARELTGSGARVLMIDRYEVGERQTSACGIPTVWMHALGLEDAIQQTFASLLVHTPHGTVRWELPWSFSTFDYRAMCELLREQSPEVPFETAKVDGRTGDVVHTDRGDLRAELIVDGLGWRRLLGDGDTVQPPEARLSRGLEVHPFGGGPEMELWIDRSYVPAGYGWSFPADEEVRVGAAAEPWPRSVNCPTSGRSPAAATRTCAVAPSLSWSRCSGTGKRRSGGWVWSRLPSTAGSGRRPTRRWPTIPTGTFSW